MNKQTKEPLLRTVKRAEMGNRQILILRLLAILLSLVAGGIFILCIGYNPFVIYGTIITGAFRSAMAVQATVKIMIPLLICSLGVTLAFNAFLEHRCRRTVDFRGNLCFFLRSLLQ